MPLAVARDARARGQGPCEPRPPIEAHGLRGPSELERCVATRGGSWSAVAAPAVRAGSPRRSLGAVALVCVLLAAGGCGGRRGTDPVRLVPVRLVPVRLAVAPGLAAAPFNVPRRLLLPAGWRAEVWARVSGARFAVWTPERQLLVAVPESGELVLLEPRADPASPPRERLLLSHLPGPEGLGFDILDGRTVLEVAEPGRLDRYSWNSLRRTAVVSGLPDSDGLDRLKGLAVAPDHTLYVGVGSDSPGAGPRGVILAARPDGRLSIVARGVHDSEGLAIDPAGRLWAAVNATGDNPDLLVRAASGHTLVEQELPPHTAPLGLTFLLGSSLPKPWRTGAVLAVHGARDLASASHPGVDWLPWRDRTLGQPTLLAGGFQQGHVRWGRPTDAVAGSDGSLYVVDDTAGAIYRLTPH
jgi:glucose/arabinose dehydrogenase